MKFLTIKRFNGKLILLLIILAFVGIPSVSAYDDTIIGFRWNTSDSSPRLYQIDATGEVIANKPATFWNNDWNITANMKTVVVNASNTTPVLYGTNNRGDGLDLNGTYGDVMVEIPVFYTKSTFENGNFSYWISPLPSAGFAVAPMFNQRGTGTNAGTAAPYYYVGRYDANLTGSKLQSATGKAPAVSITINQARTYAENKGAGWGITNIWTLSGLRQLFYTEMLTLDSQTAWTGSRGIVDGNSAVFISGADGIDTAIYTINATGNGTGLNGKTPVSYRGIENLWGNVWQFQDGFTAIKGANNVSVINATGLGLTGQKTTFAIPLGANDGQSVGELLIADGNQTNLLNTDVARPLFLPSAVGGSSTTYLSDYYYYPRSISAADPNILLSGGSWAAAGLAGVGALGTITYASDSLSSVGARLEFRRSAAAPTVTVIDPNSGVNTGSVTVTITGTNFQTGSATTLNLTRAGQATITVTDLTPASTTSITGVSLPISGAAAGIWNVTVINPDGQESGNLTTFTVTPPPPVASFSATPNHGNMPLSVSFTDESTGGTPTGWAWYFGDENYLGTVWTRQTSSAAWPARYMHTSVVLPDGSIILMGGYSSTYLDDTWRSTDQGKTWTEQNSSSGWEARDGHTSVALPDGSIVLMGGRSTSTYYNDTWQSTDQGKTWTEQNSSSGWEARYDSTSVALPDGSIALMGGYSPNIGYCNDTWRSTDLGKTWTEQNSSSGWEARYGSTSVALPDGSIVLMGGRSTIPYNNDTWRSTDQGKTWTEQNSTGWGGRLSPASVALPDGSVILMGGRASSNYNDTWRSTDQGETWTEQTSSAAWPARYRHTSVALSDGSIVLMGGWSGSDPYNDVWRFVTANATQSPVHTYTAAGTYTVALQDYNAGGYNSTLKSGYIIVTTSTTPTITSINPNSGTNTSSVTVSITGTNFNTTGTTTVNLTRAGQANLTVTGLTPASTTSITGVSLPISGAAAGIWNVTVINPDGHEGSNSSVTFTVNAPIPAPTVTSINPNSGTNTSSVTVSITGTNFNTTGTTTVNLTRAGQANLTVTGLTPASTTSITGVSLPISGAAAGIWNVTIINPNGQEGSNSSVTFTVNAPIPAPTVTSINPNSGTNTSSVTVSIAGTNFNTTGTTTVNLTRAGQANLTVTGLTPASTTSITGVSLPISGAAAGIWNVTVINPDGHEGSNSSVTFTVNAPIPAPTVTSINPNSGTNTSSVTVSIAGTNFNTTGTTTVNLTRAGQANLTVTGLTPASTTSITGVSLPISGAAAGIWNVTVINPDGQEGSNSSVTFTVNAAPPTTSPTPTPPPTPTAPTFVSATTNTAGTAISITFNKAMSNPTGNQNQFTYSVNGGIPQPFSAAAPGSNPTVIDLTTAGSTIAYGNVVTVNYTAGTVTSTDGGILATFNNKAVTNAVPGPTPTAPTFVSATTNTAGTAISITFSKAMNSPTGDARNFSYSVNGGTAQPFSAAAPGSNPTVIDLTTAGSTIAYGNVVTVNYTAGTVTSTDGGILATFNNKAVTNAVPGPTPTAPTFVSATTNTAGTAISITFNKAMNSPSGDARNFSYSVNGGTAQPFSAAAPGSNPTVIDLTTAGSTIAYGNKVTVNYTAGTVTSTDGGILATFNNKAVTNAVPGPTPTLIVTPASGTTAGGTFVTITGTIFTGTKAVTLGGVPATNVTVVNDTAVTATTPAHTAGAVDIVVTTPGGPVTGPGIFTYLSSIEPPVANFGGTPTSGASPLTVTFIDRSTNYPTSWNWNFGDSKTSASQNPNHTYTNPGVYNVTLIVTNSAGSSSPYTAVKNITVSTPVHQSDTIFLGVHNTDVRNNSWLFNITDVVNAGGSVIDISSTRIDYRPAGWEDIILTGSNITNDTRYIRGDSITLVVMTTPPNTHIFTGVGTARSQFVLNQKTLTQGATFGEAFVPGANNSVTSRFQQAVQGQGATLNVIGYTVEITGAAPFNANKTQTNSIFINLSASHSWVTANGGTGAIRILHLPESGSAEVLTTTYAGGDGTTDYFTAYSNGLSIYGLVGVTTSPTPTPTPTPTRAHRQAVGGYDSSGDPGYTGPTLTPATSNPIPLPTVKQTVVTVSGAGSTTSTIPPLPTNTPRSGLDAVPVLGALGLCGAIFLFRKNGN